MNLKECFEKEIRYFIDEAHRFAEVHPDQARSLSLEDVRNRDPYVERLIEAFAFLSGTIKQILDDDFTDLAQEIINSVWPHYLLPLPSCTIIEMTPIKGRIQSGQLIEKGALIETSPVSTGLPCRFTTCAPVYVRPISISKAGFVYRSDGQTSMQIRLSHLPGLNWEKIDTTPLRVYLHGDRSLALTLFYIFQNNIKNVIVCWEDENRGYQETVLSSSLVFPTDSLPENDLPLLPYPEHSFSGFRLLEEYFFFPEKFRFYDIDIFNHIGNPIEDSEIIIDLILSGEEDFRIDPDRRNFRLHCTPAINLFNAAAEPIRLNDSKPFYRVTVNNAVSGHYIPYNITKVNGLRLNSGYRTTYQSFNEYRHADSQDESAYFYKKLKYGVQDQIELLIGIKRPMGIGPEIISIDLMCSNDKVVQEVRLGDIEFPCQGIPDFVYVNNLTTPIPPVWPSLEGQNLWTIINSIALNYKSLDTPEQFKGLLFFYNRSKDRANIRRIESIDSIEIKPAENIIQGYPVRGISFQIILKDDHFINSGDLLCFSKILSRVIGMYVPINSSCHLSIIEKRSRRKYEWQVKGVQKII